MFKNIGSTSSKQIIRKFVTCHSSQSSKISAIISHDFNDEDSTFGAGRGLADLVADDRNLVEGRVGPETELGPGNVVADRGRDDDHRDSELGKLWTILGEGNDSAVSGESADEENSVNVVFF